MILNERYINALDTETKKLYADEVWDILQKSYASIGGIKGSGFDSKEDMIQNIPFWKLVKKNGKIVAVFLYKDSNGRKMVALGTDGSKEGKEALTQLTKGDLQQGRSYSEISGKYLSFVINNFSGDLKKYLVKPEDAAKILGKELTYPVPDSDPELELHPGFKDYLYSREIGGHPHTKLMIGTSGKKITK
jgi:hypothetical protein